MYRPRTELKLGKAISCRFSLPTPSILLCLLFVVLTAGPPPATAQTTSTLQGTVTDPQHLAIVGATITLSGPLLSGDIETTSDEIGSYRIPGLQPGTYKLQMSKPGFAVKMYEQLTITMNRLLETPIPHSQAPFARYEIAEGGRIRSASSHP